MELHNRHATLPAALQGLYLTTSNATFHIASMSFIAPGGFAQLFADEKPVESMRTARPNEQGSFKRWLSNRTKSESKNGN